MKLRPVYKVVVSKTGGRRQNAEGEVMLVYLWSLRFFVEKVGSLLGFVSWTSLFRPPLTFFHRS